MGKNTLTFTIDLDDGFTAGGLDMVKRTLLSQLESDTRGIRVGDVSCTVGDVVLVDNTPTEALLRVLPTYNTVGAALESYGGNLDLWRSDLDTIRKWYLAQVGWLGG